MYETELDVAIHAAKLAADRIREFHHDRSRLKVRSKEKYDLVTEADLASEHIIRETVAQSFPGDLILGEEGSTVEWDEGRRWIVDPIDGTTNFAHGFSPYCVSIALYEDLEPKIGVLLEVSHDELFTAVRGQGAFLNDKRIGVSAIDHPAGALIGTGFPVSEGVDYTAMLALVRHVLSDTEGIRRAGSAAFDLCCVASGRLDAFYEVGLKPWDVAAGALIVMEAGGVVTDFSGSGGWLHGRQIVAGNKTIHAWLLDHVKETLVRTQ